jgi:ABC-type transporter Mla subunit MlaD
MFGLATSSKQDLILSQQATIMVDITTLTDAVAAHTATVQKLVDLVQPAATELTALRSDLAAVDPALASLAASLAAQKPALDAAVTTLQGVVAGPAAPAA